MVYHEYLLAPANLSSSFEGGSASFALLTLGSLYVHLVQCFSSPNYDKQKTMKSIHIVYIL